MTNPNSGIYQIRNQQNNKCYVGSAVNMYQRYHRHLHDLRHSKHHSIVLQRAFDKYGEDAFNFDILELVEGDLRIVEQTYLDELNPEYNMSLIATGGRVAGWTHTEAAKEKIRQASLAMWKRMSEQERNKHIKSLGAPFTGKTHTPESNEKNRQSHLGTSWGSHTDKTKEKLGKSAHTRWHTNRNIVSETCKHCEAI